MGGEPARVVGLRGHRESNPLPSFPALHPKERVWSAAVRTLNSNGFEWLGSVGQILQLNGFPLRWTAPGLGGRWRTGCRRSAGGRTVSGGGLRRPLTWSSGQQQPQADHIENDEHRQNQQCQLKPSVTAGLVSTR